MQFGSSQLMTPRKRNTGEEALPHSTRQVDLAGLRLLVDKQSPAAELCEELARAFHVQPTEVALLRLEENALRFVFPPELREVGYIPLSSSAVAAHTAATKRVDLFNRFNRVKHASVFEGVKLRKADQDKEPLVPIQKLMSAPVLDGEGNALGVVQVSRKASESCLAGPDFTREDLQQLEEAAKVLAGMPSLWQPALTT